MEEIVALAKRRGFVYPSSSIYGGMANTWDLGHYGTLLRNNIRDFWWKRFVTSRDDMVGLDAGIFLSPKAWEASGHVANFTDALIDCKNCHYRTRADHLIQDKLKDINVEGLPVEELTRLIHENKLKCPKCGQFNWTEVRRFNLLFETHVGILEEARSKAYLRGEIAQGIFLNFKNIIDTMRVRVPFGIAQQGKAFRNEITMGQFLHRTLEFDLMEFEYFIKEVEWEQWYEYWRKQMWQWALDLGIRESNLRWREHEEHERSHYSKKTMDIEYKYQGGFKEVFGIAYRTDFDLKNHTKHSGVDLSYKDPKSGESFIPHVIEPTFGLSRLTGVVLVDAYNSDEINGNQRAYLKLHPLIAPVKVAIFPLQKDEKLRVVSRLLYDIVKKDMVAEYDDSGNIGKMYRRQDEIGTPFCITIDYQTLEDKSVTIRNRDTTQQERIPVENVPNYLKEKIGIFY